MINDVTRLMRLLEFADSAFPVGTFSFSNGLESASFEGIVVDAQSLEQYTDTVVQQSLYSDVIVALNAYRAIKKGDYQTLLEADRQLFMCKMNMETRQMLTRMGKKMAEITTHITPVPLMKAWLEDINKQATPGTYPVAQAIFFEHNGLTEQDLFVAIIYGAANMVLNAALRCVKVSHYETQTILYRLCIKAADQYEVIKEFTFEDIRSFAPEMDVLAAIHEKGNMRMFMN